MPDLSQPHTLLHIHTSRCTCGETSTWSHAYTVTTRGGIRSLAPLRGAIDRTLPLIVATVATTSVPVCHLCCTEQPTTDLEAHNRWADTVRRKRSEPTNSQPQTATANRTPIRPLEDLA